MDDFAQLHGKTAIISALHRMGIDQKDEPHPRTFGGAIFQHQLSPVIFHDLFDDCET
jgi:hypothetical protein